MRRSLSLLAALALLAVAAPAAAQESTAGPPTLTVEGQATITRSPEVASVSVGVTTNDPSATAAQSRNNVIYNAVKASLAKIGVGDDAIKTSSYSMNYNPPPTPEPAARNTESVARAPIRSGERYGYVVSRYLSVTGPPDKVGPVIDACSAAGASDIGGISFGLRDRRGAWNEALAAAVADADAQARALAASGQFHIVRLRSIQSGSAPYVPGPMVAMRMAAPATDIPQSDVSVSANVTVTYVIAP
jgi:uncharacterized protein